ncbi:MAG: creatininase family protein [Desulfurococcales archaeon]|nr:creatininase family protein [Desulfurococcales archaeon]
MPRYLPYMSYREFEEGVRGSLIVLPVGSLEQHCGGPLGADALIAEALAFRSCLVLESKGVSCIILPTLYYGFSPEWVKAPGTVTLSLSSLASVIDDIVSSLARHGVDKLAIVNAHGGNSGLLEAVSRELSKKYGVLLGVFDYWRVSGLKLGHCDDIERDLLSSLLYLDPDCSCEHTASIPPYRLTGQLPPDTGIEGSPSPGYRVIAYKLAKALEEFYRQERSQPPRRVGE